MKVFSNPPLVDGMRALVVALVALAGVGCAAPDTLDVNYQGSDAGYEAALQAAELWNHACGAGLVVVHRGEGDVPLREQVGVNGNAFGETTRERPILGAFGEKRPTDMWFLRGGYALPVIAHEMGHAMGLGHTDHGIMKPGAEFDLLDPATNRKTLVAGAIDVCP